MVLRHGEDTGVMMASWGKGNPGQCELGEMLLLLPPK